MTSRHQIVEDNLKALESLAMVGLVPKVMTILETRGAWEEEKEEVVEQEEGQAAVAADGSSLVSPEIEVGVEAGETEQEQQQQQLRRRSGGPKVRTNRNYEQQ